MSKYALSQGILLFSFAMILLGLPETAIQENPVVIFGCKLPVFPPEFYKGLGIFAVAISIVLMVAVFYKKWESKIEAFLEELPRTRRQGFVKLLFFAFSLLVYVIGWLKGLANISPECLIFDVVFWVGLIWFFIIPIVWLVPAFRRLKP